MLSIIKGKLKAKLKTKEDKTAVGAFVSRIKGGMTFEQIKDKFSLFDSSTNFFKDGSSIQKE